MYTCIYHDFLHLCPQDTVVIVPPYPYSIEEDPHNVPLKDGWYARPQIFFKCTLCPKDGRQPKNPSYRIDPDDVSYYLVFSNPFEELTLPTTGPASLRHQGRRLRGPHCVDGVQASVD